VRDNETGKTTPKILKTASPSQSLPLSSHQAHRGDVPFLNGGANYIIKAFCCQQKT
jgi:hypothetical protein